MKRWAAVGLVIVAGCLNRGELGITSTLEVTPDALPADGNSFALVKAFVASDGLPIPETAALVLYSSEPNAMITQFGAADASGYRWAQVRSRVPGTETLSVSVTYGSRTRTLSSTALVTFNPVGGSGSGVPSSMRSWLVANPNLVSDDGQESTTLTVGIVDDNNIPLPGVAVAFTSSGTNNYFSAVSGVTDIDGLLTTTLTSTMAELKTVTAHTSTIAVSTQVTFSPLGASSFFSSLVVSPNALTADGVDTSILTLVVRDTLGLPLADAPVNWSITGGNNTLVPGALVTDSNGVAMATLVSTTAEPKVVTATSGTLDANVVVIFLPGSIDTSSCTLDANPSVVIANDSNVAVLTFAARDAFGNAIPNATVSLSSTGSSNTLNPPSGTTDAAGMFTATLASSKAEVKTVGAVSGAVSLNQTVTFVAGAPSASSSMLTASPNVVVADGSATATLTIALEDAEGNPASGQAVTFSASGANNVFAPLNGMTDATGTFTTTLASTTAETKLVMASFAGQDTTTDVVFVSGPPASNTTTLSAAPTALVADGSSTSALTVTVRDAFGNSVGSQAVSLSATGSNNTLTPPSGTTNASGVFTATVTSTTAEVKVVTATATSATATAAVTFAASAPSAATSTLSANPATVTADGSARSTLTVTVLDSHGNPAMNQNVTVSSSGSNNMLTPSSGTTDSTGVFVATLASTTAETKTVTVTAASVVQTANILFVAGAPASATTTFGANPTSVTADSVSTTMLTITVFDAFGNAVPNQSVSLSSSGSNNVFASATGTTSTSGVYSTTLASSVAEIKTVTATAGSLTKAAAVTFTAGTPASADSSLIANPLSLIADGVATTQLTFTVKDQFGNPVANQNVTLGSAGTNNTVTPASGTTDSTGTFAATMASTKAETKTITAVAGAATVTTSVTFNPGPVSALTTSIVANPNSVAADGSSMATLVTTALDAQGNPVPGKSVSLSGSGTSNTFAPSSGSTDPSGVFTSTLSSTWVQAETISALVAGTVTANTNVTFTTPLVNAQSSTIVASPNTLTADGVTETTITVTVLNDTNSPVASAAVTMSSTGGNYTFSPVSGSTNSSGVFTTTLASTQAGIKIITATVVGASLNTNVTFLAGAPDSSSTTLLASPNTVTADGSSKATLTVTVYDVNGNPVANQNVSLACTGTSNTLSPSTGITDATGTFIATLASTTAEGKTVTATVNAIQKTAPVNFVAGTVSGTTTTFVASPNTATADGTAAITFTATVEDAHGNPVPNQAVALSSTGSNNAFSPPSGSTNGAGVFVATLKSTKAEFKAVTAAIGSVNENANVTFVAGAASGSTSTLLLAPTSITANGNTTSITVTVRDAQGNLVANQNVVLSGNGAANTFTPAGGQSNGSGVFTATLSSTVAQTETITAALGTANLIAAMTFTPGAPNSSRSTVSANPNTLPADGNTTSAVTVTVKDVNGNAVSNQTVTVAADGTANAWSATTGTTNSSGVWSTTLSSTKAQVKTITATIGTFPEIASITFVSGPPSSAACTLSASPASLPDDGTTTTSLQITVEDATGNPINAQAVTFTSTGTGYTFNTTTCSTSASGVCFVTLASSVAQTANVTASFAGLSKSTPVTFNVGAVNATHSTFTINPTSLTANGNNTTLTVTAKDSTGNAIAGQAVSFTASGFVNSFSTSAGATDASGVFVVTLSSTLAQAENVTAALGAVNLLGTVTFTAGPAASATSNVRASPASVLADGNSSALVTVTVKDAYGNPVASQGVSITGNGTGNRWSNTVGTTDALGVWTTTLASVIAQTELLTATIGTFNETTNVSFVPGTIVLSGTSLALGVGQVAPVIVTVNDPNGHALSTYRGSVHFTSSDGAAVLPGDYTFTFADNGAHTFASGLTFMTVGTQSVTATDANWSTSGSEQGIVVTTYVVQGIFAGEDSDSACVTLSNNQAKCWGYESKGELGYGDTKTRGATAATMGSALPFLNLGTGRTTSALCTNGGDSTSGHACALLDTGDVKCWGADASGQLGYGDTVERHAPNANTVVPLGGVAVASVACGFTSTYAVATNGNVLAWGANNDGGLGLGDTATRLQAVTVPLPPGRTATLVEAGAQFACALLDDGTVTCWGHNSTGQLGLGDTIDRTSASTQTPLSLGAGLTAKILAAGPSGACVIRSDGQMLCWGDNSVGGLGVGDTVPRLTPTLANPLPGNAPVAHVAASGNGSTCASDANGFVSCWGQNSAGELGLGDTVNRTTPTARVNLGTGRTATSLAMGNFFVCAVLDTKMVKCWGANHTGELGLGDTANRGDTPATTGDGLPTVTLW